MQIVLGPNMDYALCTLSFASVGLYVFPEERFGARPAYDTFIYIMYSLVYNLGVFFISGCLLKFTVVYLTFFIRLQNKNNKKEARE